MLAVKIVEGVGIEGWVEVDNDWKFVCVGNEKPLRSAGGKLLVGPDDQQRLNALATRHHSAGIVYVSVEDELCTALALAGGCNVTSHLDID